MFGGLILEIIGYVARVQMHYNPFLSSSFLMYARIIIASRFRLINHRYLVCLTIGPAFLAAAVYFCLSRIVIVYSESVSRLKPATYTVVFITGDFIALLLQAAGGGIASSANTISMDSIGKNIMVAGVAWQVASLVIFATLCADFALRIRKASMAEMNPAFSSFRQGKSFQCFLWSLGAATTTIFIRSVFRCAELSGGFHGPLANQQVTFMILEGAMICIASICLTVFHPGWVFGQNWHLASWKIRTNSTPKLPIEHLEDSKSSPKADGGELASLPYSAMERNAA